MLWTRGYPNTAIVLFDIREGTTAFVSLPGGPPATSSDIPKGLISDLIRSRLIFAGGSSITIVDAPTTVRRIVTSGSISRSATPASPPAFSSTSSTRRD